VATGASLDAWRVNGAPTGASFVLLNLPAPHSDVRRFCVGKE